MTSRTERRRATGLQGGSKSIQSSIQSPIGLRNDQAALTNIAVLAHPYHLPQTVYPVQKKVNIQDEILSVRVAEW